MRLAGVRKRLERRATRAGLQLSAELVAMLASYFGLLMHWNEKINLTSLGESDDAVDRLLVEPLVASKYLRLTKEWLLDIGSGGGSPAIPLKLANPDIRLWMVESKTRKSAFLREVVRSLDLTDAHVETCRYEELLSRAELHEAMDAVCFRAIRVETRVFSALQAFVRPGGRLVWFRGPGGGDASESLVPPLELESTHGLIESLRSRVVVVRKRELGRE